MQRVAIINSRQALRPTGASAWLSATIGAIEKLSSEGEYIFLASLGETTYELALFHLGRAGVEIEIVLTADQLGKYASDENELKRYLSHEFHLEANKLRVVCVSGNGQTASDSSHARDLEILKRADIVAPVSIRAGGFWSEHLENCKTLTSEIDRRFEIPYQNKRTHIKRDYNKLSINPKSEKRLEDYLVHWSRTSNHPWPGETRFEFYQALSEARELYPRSAIATIERILTQKRICASTRHMVAENNMVSLTSTSLTESVALMKYRTRYREMTFEPYAIAIPLETAQKQGAIQVTYYSANDFGKLSTETKLFAHSQGANGANWAREKEWRIRGDVDLRAVWSELVVLTENRNQANRISEAYGVEALAVFDDL